MQRVMLCQPHNGWIVPASADAAMQCGASEGIDLSICRVQSSLLAHAFNGAVASCQNKGSDWFALLHADLAPAAGWLRTMLDAADQHGLDVVHAPAAIKDGSGYTSTALAYTDDPWDDKRRLTVTELAKLPEVFTIDDVNEHIDEAATILLPNTGCLLIRCGEWFADWEGFYMLDRVTTQGGERKAVVVPEDWLFGYEADAIGLKVGGCKVDTVHHGGMTYTTARPWGRATDEDYTKPRERVA